MRGVGIHAYHRRVRQATEWWAYMPTLRLLAWNVDVERTDTFYVTTRDADDAVWVHNADCGGSDDVERLPPNRISASPKKRGQPPKGDDGNPVELQHDGQKNDSPLKEMTQSDHRGGDNFRKNHENTGQAPSQIDRSSARKKRRDHWNREWDSGRWK